MSKILVTDLQEGMFFKLPLGTVLQVVSNQYATETEKIEFICVDYIGNERHYSFANNKAGFVGAEFADGFPEHLVQNLKEYRERTEIVPSKLRLFRDTVIKLNQKKTAAQLGVSPTIYSDIERGHREVSEAFQKKFMQFYPDADRKSLFS